MISWELHKDGNWYGYRNDHEKIGYIFNNIDSKIAALGTVSTITNNVGAFSEIDTAKAWVVAEAKKGVTMMCK